MSENDWKNDDFLAFGLGDNIRSGNNANDESNDAAGAPAKDVDAGDRRRKKRAAAGAHPATATNPTGVDLPPWMDERLAWQQNPRNHRRPAPLVALHNEIVEFAQLMEPRPEEVRQREELVRMVRELAEQTFGKGRERCTVQVFGSQATGLFLPTSDIDLVLLIPEAAASAGANGASASASAGGSGGGGDDDEQEAENQKAKEKREMEEWDATTASSSSRSPLVVLGEALRRHWIDDLSFL